MNKADSPSMPTQAPTEAEGNILLYLPWEFDMLGGVDVVVDRLWKGLETAMPGRAIIGIQDWHVQGEKTDTEGRRFLHLNIPAPPAKNGLAAWRYRLALGKWLPRLLRTLKQHKITTVNVHFPTLNTYLLALLKHFGLWRGRLILSFHGSDVNDLSSNCLHWRLIARYTDATTACSASLATLIDSIGLFSIPTTVIYNGIDCQRFADQAGPIPSEIRRPYILNVGNYVPRKGQDVLLESFAQIMQDYPDLNLVCVGGSDNGEWLQYLKNLSQQLQLAYRVTLLENQSQATIAGLMKNSVCLAHTAHNEPFGLVLIEAAACSTPVIASRVGGIPEIIKSDEFGLCFTDGNIAELTDLLHETINNLEKTEIRKFNFHNRAQTIFSAETMTNNYISALSK